MATTFLLIGTVLFGWQTSSTDAKPAKSVVPYEIELEVSRIEALHRSILRCPVEAWDLAPVRQGYEALSKRSTDPKSLQILNARLDRVASQEQVAESARTVQTLLDRGRKRDAAVAKVTSALDALERPSKSNFAAVGQIQPSSRQVDGKKVFVLIGKKGYPIAYLDVPPGIDAGRLTARRVGVRGQTRYSEELGNRLIAVRDLETVE